MRYKGFWVCCCRNKPMQPFFSGRHGSHSHRSYSRGSYFHESYPNVAESIQSSKSTLRSMHLVLRRAWKSHGDISNLLQTCIIVNSPWRYLSRSLFILFSSNTFFNICLRYSDLSRFISLMKLDSSFKNLSDILDTLMVVGFNRDYLSHLYTNVSKMSSCS